MFKLDRNLKALFISNLLFSLSYNLVSPLFPLFLNDLGANVAEIGVVLFAGGLVATILVFPAGLMADRFRRRNILIFGFLLSGLAALCLLFVRNWTESILAIMLFLGALSIFMPARHSIIADNAEPAAMATTYSVMNIAWPIGSVIGPALAGFIADKYGWRCTFCTSMLFSFASILPASLFERTRKGNKNDDERACRDTRSVVFTRYFVPFMAVFLLFQVSGSIAIGIIEPIVPLYLTLTFSVDNTAVGFFFSMAIGFATLLAQLPGGIMADKYGHEKVLAFVLLPLPLLTFLWPHVADFYLVTLLYMLIAGFWSMTWGIAVSLLMALTPTVERGLVVGTRQGATRLGFTIGPVVGAYFWTFYGVSSPFITSSSFFIVAFLLVLLLRKTKPKLT